MQNQNIEKKLCKTVDSVLKNSITRRDAIKFGILSSTLGIISPSMAATNNNKSKTNSNAKIVIVGAGLAGVSVASGLSRAIENPDITIIEPNKRALSYQSGQTFVASGIWNDANISYDVKSCLPKNTKWIQNKVTSFAPDSNYIILHSGEKIAYDYLVVASGLVLNYGQIRGLEDVGSLYSSGENKKAANELKKLGVNSIYFKDGAIDTWESMKKLVQNAKNGKKIRAIFTEPNGPIKGVAAPKTIVNLMDARLREASSSARKNTVLHLYLNNNRLIESKTYSKIMGKQFKEKDIRWNYSYNLTEIDVKNKIVIFKHNMRKKDTYNSNVESHIEINKQENIKIPYNFIHITPPMSPAKEISNSYIADSSGFVDVDKERLVHTKYDNIFAIGDVVNIPIGKTTGSIRKQYPVVVKNIISSIKGEPILGKYDGYTSHQVTTSLNSTMLVEMDWKHDYMNSVMLDPLQDRWIWWIYQAYFLKPMTIYGVAQGRI